MAEKKFKSKAHLLNKLAIVVINFGIIYGLTVFFTGVFLIVGIAVTLIFLTFSMIDQFNRFPYSLIIQENKIITINSFNKIIEYNVSDLHVSESQDRMGLPWITVEYKNDKDEGCSIIFNDDFQPDEWEEIKSHIRKKNK